MTVKFEMLKFMFMRKEFNRSVKPSLLARPAYKKQMI